jgi:hypothetical protein
LAAVAVNRLRPIRLMPSSVVFWASAKLLDSVF